MPQSIGNNCLVILNPVHKGLVWVEILVWLSLFFSLLVSSSLWPWYFAVRWGSARRKLNRYRIDLYFQMFLAPGTQRASASYFDRWVMMTWWTLVCYSSFSTMTSPWRTLLLWRSMCRNSWGNTERQTNTLHKEKSRLVHPNTTFGVGVQVGSYVGCTTAWRWWESSNSRRRRCICWGVSASTCPTAGRTVTLRIWSSAHRSRPEDTWQWTSYIWTK